VKNIFVGNLSFNTNEDELRQLFEAHGQVDRVSIMTDRDTGRSRGFGFVEMASNEDGEKAITALNGSQVGGRTRIPQLAVHNGFHAILCRVAADFVCLFAGTEVGAGDLHF